MSRVLITGATGFIGRMCLEKLQENNFEIHATYQNKPIHHSNHVFWHDCNILNALETTQLITKVKPEYLIHLAWFVDHKTYWTSEKNIDFIYATSNLYQTFSKNGGQKAILIGTSAEYDNNHSICEETKTPLNPSTLYGICKKQTFELIHQLKKLHPNYAAFTWVRLFNIYGPHENKFRLIPYLFTTFFQEKSPVLQTPKSIRDYIHVDNLSEILVNMLTIDTPETVNAGSGDQFSIEELANIIHKRFFSNKTTFQYANIIPPPDCLIPDLTTLNSLNIKLPHTLDSCLKNTYDWYKLNTIS